jgi:DNA-directed RNA polymerase sigma subunit (sigma70/sigma32)
MRILCSTVLLLGLAGPQATAWLPCDRASSGWQSRSLCTSTACTTAIRTTTHLFSARASIDSFSSSSSSSTNPNTLENRDSSRDSSNSNSNNYNILEDGAGHVNRDLAERIWDWEQQRRKSKNLPKVPYSVRAAMRLVDSVVEEAVNKRYRIKSMRNTQNTNGNGGNGGGNNNNNNNRNDSEKELYSDLIQEGLSALLDVMSEYDDTATTTDSRNMAAADFEATARRHIRARLAAYLEQDSRPVRLPVAVKAVVKQAKSFMKSMYQATGREPTLSQVAEKMDLPVARLQDYLRLARTQSTLSMESTVEISNPAEDASPAFADQDEWELQQGMLLDNGKTLQRDELVGEYKDKMLELEGDDEAWVLQERIAGPLQELIPDNEEPTPDDVALSEMIRHDMSEFLTSTLDPQEVQVVRLSFGLDSGKALSVSQTAKTISITKEEAAKLLQRGLEKLRASYTSRYVESYLDEDEEPYDFVDSV